MSDDDNDTDSAGSLDSEEIRDLFDDPMPKNKDSLDDNNLMSTRYKPSISGKVEIPWVEKYRPKNLDDIIQQDEVVKVLKNTLVTGELPHLLLFGPPGTGKTSTILAIALQLFGPRVIHERVIELNASDERGIGIVRDTIITFAKISIGSKDPKYPCPNFKIIILDEADAMTPEAQAALRKAIEKMSGITRFCFICNYISKIIDPISSRCTQFRFKPIQKHEIFKKLTTIAKNESINIDDECINKIVDISEGDVRRSIMTLQNTKYIIKYAKTVTPRDIIKMTGGIDDTQLKNFWKICSTGSISDIRSLTLSIQRGGYQVKNILNLLQKSLLDDKKLSSEQKSKISMELCQTDKKLTEGSDEYLQILNILLYSNMIIKNK
jgi:replication factor C subunit 2/4